MLITAQRQSSQSQADALFTRSGYREKAGKGRRGEIRARKRRERPEPSGRPVSVSEPLHDLVTQVIEFSFQQSFDLLVVRGTSIANRIRRICRRGF